MSVVQRVSKLLKANVNHLLDSAEEPEVMLKQILRDMEESIVDLRREVVGAVAWEKRLNKKITTSRELALEREKKAALALDHGDRDLARRVLGERVTALNEQKALEDELQGASGLTRRLKNDLSRMETQAEVARRRQQDLVRRKRFAETRLRSQESARRSAELTSGLGADPSLDGYADQIDGLELRKRADQAEIDRELERLERAASA